MADERKLVIRLIGDERDLLRAFKSSSQASQRFSVGLGTVFKSALVFEGVARGLDGIGRALRAGASEFSEQQKVAAQTAAVLKSTGNVAGVTAKQVDELSASISRYSGIDDEAVQAGQNLLLTFPEIRNEVGKGNDVFNQATRTVADLSVAMGIDMRRAALQVGKALNDPARGYTRLQRIGVQFSKTQTDQIKKFVSLGKVANAQKVILAELTREFGGSARALGQTVPGQLERLRETFRNIGGDLVGALAGPAAAALEKVNDVLPSIQRAVSQVADVVGPAVTRIGNALVSGFPDLSRVGGAILDPLRNRIEPIAREIVEIVGRMWANVVDAFSSNSGSLKRLSEDLGEVLRNVWTVARPTIVFLFEKALPAAIRIAIPVLEKVASTAKVMSRIWVAAVNVIVQAIEKFLGGLQFLSDAASKIPGVGKKFDGVSERIGAAREGLRAFSGELDALNGKTVSVNVEVDTTTGRREEGAAGHSGTGAEAEQDKKRKAAQAAAKAADAAAEAAKRRRAAAAASQRATEQGAAAAEKAAAAAERQRKSFETMMDRLGLKVDIASANNNLRGQLDAMRRQEKTLLDQVKVEGHTVELDRRLFQLRQERVRLLSESRQQNQFLALGLTADGSDKVPGVASLKKRLASLSDQIGGTALDTTKTRSQLQRIAKVLAGEYGKVGDTVRAAIVGMFDKIRDALKDNVDNGQITKTKSLNAKSLLGDVSGLTAAQIKQLRANLARFNTGGVALAGPAQTVFQPTNPGWGAAVIENNVTVELDGEVVGRTVSRHQERRRNRNRKQKRGPNA